MTSGIYKAPSDPQTTSDVAGPIAELARLRRVAADFEVVPVLTTDAERHRTRLRTELAVRSVRAHAGLDRDLAAEIDRNAWGISGE